MSLEHPYAWLPGAHQIEWSQHFKDAAPDDWQQWPDEARRWVERAFARAMEKFPGCSVLSDASGCTRKGSEKFLLWREMWIVEATVIPAPADRVPF